MPDREYGDHGDSMEECAAANSDKNDPHAYCAQVYENIHGHYPHEKGPADAYDDPKAYLEDAVEAMKAAGVRPTEDRISDLRERERSIARGGP